MELKLFTNEEKFITASADYIESCSNFEGAKVALSGGSTPRPVYKALSKRELYDFKKVQFFMVDERYVPPTDPKSNYKLIVEAMPKAHLHSFDTDLPIDESVKDYEDKLHEYLIGPLNLCVLGIGTDGHFASIFPNSPAINEKELLIMHTQTENHDIKDRLTMTMPLIMQSEKLLVLVKSSEKWEAIQKLSDDTIDPDSFPAKHLMNHHSLLIHFLQS
jgi:6-phosphogluconolactonase